MEMFKENNVINNNGNENGYVYDYGIGKNRSIYVNDKNLNENYFTRSMLPSITPEVNIN